jgi:hypothetical protein
MYLVLMFKLAESAVEYALRRRPGGTLAGCAGARAQAWGSRLLSSLLNRVPFSSAMVIPASLTQS